MTHWAKSEFFNESRQWRPLRTDSLTDDSGKGIVDPFQCVLFEDVNPFLIDLSTHGAKQKLIHTFIGFLYGGTLQLGHSEPGWAFPRCRDPSMHPFSAILGREPFGLHKDSGFDYSGQLRSFDGFPLNRDLDFIKTLGWVDFLKYLDISTYFS